MPKTEKEKMDEFFGGWSMDERSTEEIMMQIRSGRNPPTSTHHANLANPAL